MMIIKICTGSSCHLNGSYDVIQEFKGLLKKYDVGVNVKCETGSMMNQEMPNMTLCDDGFLLHHVTKENAEDLFVKQIYPLLNLK